MITRNNLPLEYVPYQNLSLCSNSLLDGGHLLVIGEVLPLLVGSGETPKIWLQAPEDATGKNYISLVVASVPAHPGVSMTSDGSSLYIYVGETKILHVVQHSKEAATIDHIDLRPIGFNINGNAFSLHAGGMSFSRSSFSGGGAVLGFG